LDFKTKTQWVAITGAPSSGKTSVIQLLESKGYPVQPEVARAVIERKLAAGLTLEQVREDYAGLQREILGEKLRLEDGLDPGQVVFLDRGTGDSLTYFRLAGVDNAPAREAALRHGYRAVLIFDRLPDFTVAAYRNDAHLAEQLDRELEEDYRTLGYTPIRIPVMPVEERAAFVLKALGLDKAA
jgi:predicted ATPase